MRNTWKPEELETLKEYLRFNATASALAVKLGRSVGSVKAKIGELGLRKREFLSGKLKGLISKEKLYELYWEKGYSLTEIAKIYGVDANTINYHMKKWGIQRRPPSQAFKGKRRSEEFKKKLRMKLKGRKKTAEQRKKISETLKLRYKNGEIKPWSKGLTKNNDKRLAEIARKVSLAKKRPYIEKVCKVCGKSFQVRPCRAKTAKYCSIKCRAIGMRGRKQSWVDKRIKSVIKGLKRRPTKPEKAFMQMVEKHNLPYRYNGNRGHLIIGGRVPDFYNIHSKEVIEILGRAFHDPNHPSPFPKRTPEQLIHHYAKYGFKCITLWEDEVYNENEVLERISK